MWSKKVQGKTEPLRALRCPCTAAFGIFGIIHFITVISYKFIQSATFSNAHSVMKGNVICCRRYPSARQKQLNGNLTFSNPHMCALQARTATGF
jgi:hypothetical protein